MAPRVETSLRSELLILQSLMILSSIVAEEIAEVPFTPGHEMVGQVSYVNV